MNHCAIYDITNRSLIIMAGVDELCQPVYSKGKHHSSDIIAQTLPLFSQNIENVGVAWGGANIILGTNVFIYLNDISTFGVCLSHLLVMLLSMNSAANSSGREYTSLWLSVSTLSETALSADFPSMRILAFGRYLRS